jgi:hypothetical protein
MKKLLKVIKLTWESFKYHWKMMWIDPDGRGCTDTVSTEAPKIFTPTINPFMKLEAQISFPTPFHISKLLTENWFNQTLKPPEEQRIESLRNHIRKNREWQW